MRSVTIQTSMCIRAIWSETSLGTFRIVKDVKCLYEANEDSNQSLSLRWAHKIEGTFSQVASHIV